MYLCLLLGLRMLWYAKEWNKGQFDYEDWVNLGFLLLIASAFFAIWRIVSKALGLAIALVLVAIPYVVFPDLYQNRFIFYTVTGLSVGLILVRFMPLVFPALTLILVFTALIATGGGKTPLPEGISRLVETKGVNIKGSQDI